MRTNKNYFSKKYLKFYDYYTFNDVGVERKLEILNLQLIKDEKSPTIIFVLNLICVTIRKFILMATNIKNYLD